MKDWTLWAYGQSSMAFGWCIVKYRFPGIMALCSVVPACRCTVPIWWTSLNVVVSLDSLAYFLPIRGGPKLNQLSSYVIWSFDLILLS